MEYGLTSEQESWRNIGVMDQKGVAADEAEVELADCIGKLCMFSLF